MNNQEIEIFLRDKSESLGLKKKAVASLEKVFLNNTMEELDLKGFERTKIKQIFERFEYHVGNPISVIRTRLELYEGNDNKLAGKVPIGYYELETNFNGEYLDEYFVIY